MISKSEWQRHGDEFTFTWPDLPIVVTVNRFYEDHEAISAELMFQTTNGGHVHITRLNLIASRTRAELAKHLRRRAEAIEWEDLIEQVCAITLREWRREAPPKPLTPVPFGPTPLLLDPLLPEGEPIVFYGDGEVGKSLFTLAMALSLTKNASIIPGITCIRSVATLYLDWETNETTHGMRVDGLLRGAGLSGGPGNLYYLAMRRPLHENIGFLRTEIGRLGVGFVVVDSFAYACGKEPETADAAMRVFSALRQLTPATIVVLAHVPQILREEKGPARPYGSVFVRNSARVTWELRHTTTEKPRTFGLGLFQTKNNLGPKHDPMGYLVEFSGQGVTIEPFAVETDPELAEHLPTVDRILAAIKGGAKTYRDIQQVTGTKAVTVRGTCARLERQGRIIRTSQAGKVPTWAASDSPGGGNSHGQF